MPRFFFDVHDDLDTFDEDGRELADARSAKAEAISGARSLASEQVTKGYLNLGHLIQVCDENRKPLFTVTFDEAVKVTH